MLLAFLLTVPFAERFGDLDTWGRRAYEAALTCSMLSVVLLLGPTFLHRFGERTARRDRLLWSIRLMVVGLILLGIALLAALWGVARFVFGDGSALQLVVPVVVAMVVVWLVVPMSLQAARLDRGPAVRRRTSERRRLVTRAARRDLAGLHLGLVEVARAAGRVPRGPAARGARKHS